MSTSITLRDSTAMIAKELIVIRDKAVEFDLTGNSREYNKIVKRIERLEMLFVADVLAAFKTAEQAVKK